MSIWPELDLGQVEHVVEDVHQRPTRRDHHVEHLALLLAELGVSEDRGEAEHAVHRRADLVAHGGQERALGLVRPLRRLGLLLERLGELARLRQQARAHLGGEQHVERAVGGREIGELQLRRALCGLDVGNVAEHQPDPVAAVERDAAHAKLHGRGLEADDHGPPAPAQAGHVADAGRALDLKAREELRAHQIAAGMGDQRGSGCGDPSVGGQADIGGKELGKFAVIELKRHEIPQGPGRRSSNATPSAVSW